MNKIPKIKYLSLLLLGLAVPIASQAQDQKPIVFTPNVPIGDFSGPITVTNELLGNYINTWYGFVVGAVGIMATVMIMYAGFKWLASRGNATTISDAKDKIWSAIIGLFLVFSSYIILQVINGDLVNPTLTGLNNVDVNLLAGNQAGSEDNIPETGFVIRQADTARETEVRTLFANSSIGINAGADRTQVGELRQTTIDQLLIMNRDFTERGGGDEFVVTGGSERAGHSSGSTHSTGIAVDIRDNSRLDSFIEGSMISGASQTNVGQTYPIYEINYNGRPTRIIDERTRPGASHWHIEFR
jgi:hypothetical protein